MDDEKTSMVGESDGKHGVKSSFLMKKTNLRSEGKSVSSIYDSDIHFNLSFIVRRIYVEKVNITYPYSGIIAGSCFCFCCKFVRPAF